VIIHGNRVFDVIVKALGETILDLSGPKSSDGVLIRRGDRDAETWRHGASRGWIYKFLIPMGCWQHQTWEKAEP
jgi:hypothetical protein